jgi:DNA gyrase inhibitor GyrI
VGESFTVHSMKRAMNIASASNAARATDLSRSALETGTLPGGRYARVRLQGEPPAVYEFIAPAFEKLAKRGDHDKSRLAIEFYRRRDVIDLLLPIA